VVKADARWEDDSRGEGVGDGANFLPPLEQLKEAMTRANWIAEDPEAHLLPHLKRWCDKETSTLAIDGTSSTDGVFEISLVPRVPLSEGECRRDVFALLGTIAEGATYVHQQQRENGTLFEVTTGLLDDQTTFRSHGHTIRFLVADKDS
jgi:hypothetical protein